MKDILIFVPPNAVSMSISIIKDLCYVASQYYYQEANLKPEHVVKLVSENSTSVQCFNNMEISIEDTIDKVDIENISAFFVGAFWSEPSPILKQSKQLIDLLRKLQEQEIPIVAVSNGSYFLAEAGLLTDKTATIYPPSAAQFRERYPGVDLQEEKAITNAQNIFCANGMASGCDLAVTIIERLYGPKIARRISHEFLIGFNRDYDIANIELDGQKYHKDQSILAAQQWIERNYEQDVSLELLAEDSCMSQRNFSRRFKKATGDTPSKYLQRVRIEAAKALLRESNLTIAQIAEKVGYSELSYFSKRFNAHEGCMPNHYRKAVGT